MTWSLRHVSFSTDQGRPGYIELEVLFFVYRNCDIYDIHRYYSQANLCLGLFLKKERSFSTIDRT